MGKKGEGDRMRARREGEREREGAKEQREKIDK